MPRKGFSSITVRTDVYDRFYEYYQKQKIRGDSNDFSAFVVQKIESRHLEAKRLKKLASKIKYVPDKFTIPIIKPLKVLQ